VAMPETPPSCSNCALHSGIWPWTCSLPSSRPVTVNPNISVWDLVRTAPEDAAPAGPALDSARVGVGTLQGGGEGLDKQ
jgi:hypothetical protein